MNIKILRKTSYILLLCISGFLLCSSNLIAAGQRDTTKVLLVGNSYIYYNNLAQMIGLITDSLDHKIICRKSTAGGATLGEHWRGDKGLRSKSIIKSGGFDIVVIQDNSMWPLQHKDSVLFYGNLFCNKIKETGAKPYVYNTWSRQATPETQPLINQVYQEMAESNHAELIPVGQCWAKAREWNKDINLFHPDGSHPSPLGTFLIALCYVKKITGKLPENFATVYNYIDRDGETFRIMQVSEAEIKFCVKVVNEIMP
jgi:hypothetical protein